MAKKNEDSFVYIITYLFEFLSGIIVYVTIAQENKRLKRHAVQATLLGIVSIILSYAFALVTLGFLSTPVSFIIWLYCIYIGYEASKGNDIKVPFLTSYVKGIVK